VDIGATSQQVKAGWEEFSAGHQVGPEYREYSVVGTVVGVDIRIGNGNPSGYRNYAGGDLGGDLVYPDSISSAGPVEGSVILTLSNLPASDYTLVAYHNDSKHVQHEPINVTVAGAVSAATDDPNVTQTTNGIDDTNLGQSTVTFTAEGSGDVIVTYAPATDEGPDPRAVLNGFELTQSSSDPRVHFEVAASENLENVTPAVLTVILENPPEGQTVTVNYAVTGGTATAGVDYTLAGGVLSFDPGQTQKTISIDIVNDGLVEYDETIIVGLSNPVNAELGPRHEHEYTILDPNPYVSFDTESSGATEDITPAEVSVVLSEIWPEAVTVDYAVTGGTATDGIDYVLSAGTLTFEPNQDGPETIGITIVNDGVAEGDETIEITLINSVNAKLGAITQHTYTIIDLTPYVSFNSTASEGPENFTLVNIPVSLSLSTSQTVTVDYEVAGGSATGGGIDYTLADGTLTFDPCQTTPEEITVGVIDDKTPESDETIVITLSNPVNARLGTNAQHTYTIRDTSPLVCFLKAASAGTEDRTPINIAVVLSGPWTDPVTVDYAVTGGTAAGAGVDYTLPDGPLEFDPGQTAKYISIDVVNDEIEEVPDETVEITLTDPVNANLGAITEHILMILSASWAKPCPKGDLNADCVVNETDLEVLSYQWLDPQGLCSGQSPGCANLDGAEGVNLVDYALLAGDWLVSGTQVVVNEFLASNNTWPDSGVCDC
jgi:hypothetical protein